MGQLVHRDMKLAVCGSLGQSVGDRLSVAGLVISLPA